MIKQSDQAAAAWKATERTLDAIVTIDKTEYKTSDLTSIEYDAGAFTGDTFSIGSNYENGVTIKFAHLVEGLKPGMKVYPKIGVKTSTGYEYSPLGVFIISDDIQMDRNNDATSIKCMDQMCMMEGIYTSKLTYPARVVDVIAEIGNMAGVPLNTADLGLLPTLADLPSAITGLTYRNAIGLIAQFYAGFATFDRDGKLTIRTIAVPDIVLDPGQYEQGGLTKNEAPFKIGGIQVQVTTSAKDSTGTSTDTTVTLQAGSTAGSQIKLTNNLMTQSRLDNIWGQLKDLTFYPFSLNWFGNPAVEAGDWLTLKDTKGNEFNVPNNGYTMTFDGSLSAVSKADQTATTGSSYVYQGNLSQTIQVIQARHAPNGNNIYGTDVTTPPTGAKLNDIWYKQNGNAVEMWSFNRQSDGSGKWELSVSDTTGAKIKAEVEEQMKDVPVAIANAQTAVDTANGAVKQAGFSSDIATQAKVQAATAASDALKALTNSSDALGDVTQAQADAKSAVDSAIAADASATTALTNAKAALSTANGTASSLADLKTEVLAKADVTVVDDLKGTVTNQGLLLTKTGNELALKANKETVDTINQTVKNQAVQVTANAKAIALKADQTVVDKVSQTVTNQGLAITAATDGLKLKADTSRVDSLNKTVTNQGLEITANANKFAVQLSDTTTKLNSLADSRDNLVMQSYFEDGKTGGWSGNPSVMDNPDAGPITGHTKIMEFGARDTSEVTNMINVVTGEVYYFEAYISTYVAKYPVAFGFSARKTDDTVTWISAFTVPVSSRLAKHTGSITIPVGIKYVIPWLQIGGPATSDLGTASGVGFRVTRNASADLAQTVSTHTTAIEANKKGLSLKSNQTTVDTLAGRVTTAEGKITVFDNQIKQSVTKSDLSTTLNGYATQSWTSGQIVTTADSLKLSVAKVQTDFDSLQIGGRNYLTDTNSDFTKYSTDNWNLKIFKVTDASSLQALQGQNVVVQAAFTEVHGKGVQIEIWANGHRLKESSKEPVNGSVAAATKGKIVTYVTLPDTLTSLEVHEVTQNQAEGYVSSKHEQLEIGTKASDWSPSPGDLATKASVSSFEVTLDGLQGTVSSEVSGLKAQQTLLADQYTSVIESRDNLILTPYFDSGSVGTWDGGEVLDNSSAQALTGHSKLIKFSKVNTYERNWITVSPGDVLYFEAWISSFNTSLPVSFGVHGIKSGGSPMWREAIRIPGNTGMAKVTGTFTVTADVYKVQPWLKISGTSGDDLGFGTAVGLRMSRSPGSSQITQLQKDINLRVTQDGIISQINVSPESILIDGKKTHITGATTIDNAAIKSAAIESLEADKIKVGTLNGSNVNIINLNASNITAGVLSGPSLNINLDTGQVTFQKGRIHSNNNNIDINVDSGYLSVANDDTRVMLKDGQIQLVQPQLFDTSTTPYLKISNSGNGAGWAGASFIGRDFSVLSTMGETGNVMTFPLGVEKFAGVSTGSSNEGKMPTKIGGAERGVLISGGAKTTSYSVNSSPYIYVGSAGSKLNPNGRDIIIESDHTYIWSAYLNTTSASANLHVGDTGNLTRVTSATKYKTNIVRSFSTAIGKKLIEIPEAVWSDRAELRAADNDSSIIPSRYYGMIAEDLAAAGLELLVTRGANGEIEGIEYDRIAVALVPLVREQQSRIEELEKKLEEKVS